MSDCQFTIPGRPAPKGSRRQSASGHSYESNPRVGPWMRDAKLIMSAYGRRLEPPYRVTVCAVYEQPKRSVHGWPASGDADKVCRACLDALQAAGVIVNDSHVTQLRAVKQYGPDAQTLIRVESLA